MADLFKCDEKTIRKHINNVFKENVQIEITKRNFYILRVSSKEYHFLDIIIFVRYRVKSQRSVYFRKWASKILK